MLIYASQPTNFGRTRFSNIPICEREVVLVAGDGKTKKERVASVVTFERRKKNSISNDETRD